MMLLALPGDMEVRLTLPAEAAVVPFVPEGEDQAAAERLLRTLHPGLFTETGALRPGTEQFAEAAVRRYAATVALRRDSGALFTALYTGLLDGELSASVVTLNATTVAYDDEPRVAAAGIYGVLTADEEGGEVMPLALPAGPAVGRVRRRTYAAGPGAETGAEPLEVGLVDVFVVVPGTNVLLVLNVVCPTATTFEAHAAMAGAVARSIVVSGDPAAGAA